MKQDVLHEHLLEILEKGFVSKPLDGRETEALILTEEDMFRLWNLLGEELGIDLSFASEDQRRLMFQACDNGKRLVPKEFGSLLWLIYYAEPTRH